MKILIADDDKSASSPLKTFLENEDHETILVHDENAALNALTDPNPPQIAVLYCHSPQKMGLSICQRIHQRTQDEHSLYLILITDEKSKECFSEALNYGVNDLLFEPVQPREVASRIKAGKHLIQTTQQKNQFENFYRLLFENYHTMLLLLDSRDAKITDANQAALTFYGYSSEEIKQKTFSDLIACSQDRTQANLQKIISEPKTRHVAMHRRNTGEKMPVEVITSHLTIDNSPIILATVLDIRNKQHAEKQLKQANLKMEQIFSSISSILISLDEDLRVVSWNQYAEESFGIQAEQAKNQLLHDLPITWDKKAIDQDIARAARTKDKVRTAELNYVKNDGSNGFLGMTISPIITNNNHNEIQGFLFIGKDITRKMVFETQMVHSQKMEAIGQLAAGIAHEINTPVQYIQGNITYLQDSWEDIFALLNKYTSLVHGIQKKDIDQALVQEIVRFQEELDLDFLAEDIPNAIVESQEGVNRVTKIVKSMKDFSHPGNQEMSPVDINKALETTITISRNEWKYHSAITTDFMEDPPLIPCFKDEINQVFLNIIVNAAQAVAEKVGDTDESGQITISTRLDTDHMEIRIQDSGKGIPKENGERIFDPFFTTKEVGKGTGQGLYLAYDIVVNKHKGKLFFDSVPDEGTTFFIQLPLTE